MRHRACQPTVSLATSILIVVIGCTHEKQAGSSQNSANEKSGWVFSQPRLGIDVAAEDRDVTFKFKICGARTGEPFIDRLILRKLRPAADEGTVCEFESESEDSVMTGIWKYGEKRRGVGRCWPLTEGEYVVVALGSGAGETKFTLSKRWFGEGYDVRILEGACR
jgi:hypothetical protein